MAKSMQQLTHINTTGMGFFYDHNAGIQCLFYEVNLGIRYDVNAVGYILAVSSIKDNSILGQRCNRLN